MQSKGKGLLRAGVVLNTNAIRRTPRISELPVTPKSLEAFASPKRRRGKRCFGKVVFLGAGLDGNLEVFPEPTFDEIRELLQFGMAVEAEFGKSKYLAVILNWDLQTIDNWLRMHFPLVFDFHDRSLPFNGSVPHWGLLRKDASGNLVHFSKQGMCGADLAGAIVNGRSIEKSTLYLVTRKAISADVYRNWSIEAAILSARSVTRNINGIERDLDAFIEEFDADELSDLDVGSTVVSDSEEEEPGNLTYSRYGSNEIASEYSNFHQRLDSIESRIQTAIATASSSKTTTDVLDSFSKATRRRKRKASLDADELRKLMEGRACGIPSSPIYDPWAEN